MSRIITAPPRRPLDHPALLARTAGITGALFALATGLSWAHLHAWPAPLIALTAVILALAAGQVLGVAWESALGDLAAAGLLAAIGAGATVRAAFVGWHSLVLEATAIGMLAAVVAGCVYGRVALSRLWQAVN